MHLKPILTFARSLSLICMMVPATTMAQTVSDEIRLLLGDVSNGRENSQSLDAGTLVPRFYEQRDFAPGWGNPDNVDALFDALNDGVRQGFQPSDFHLPELRERYEIALGTGPTEQAIFDVLATDAAAKLLAYSVFGKVDPAALDAAWNFSKPVIQQDPATVLSQFIDGDGFSALMARVTINNPQYLMLVKALAEYRSIAAKGGWPEVPAEDVLKPDMVSPAVALLRQRLAAEGAAIQPPSDTTGDSVQDPTWVYDAPLVMAVQAFQTRHGLEADGVIGPRTFLSLNKPVQDRIDKLRLSLERGRWLMRGLDGDFVLVNIAGARTYLSKADGTLWTTRSITGSAYRKTPVFRDEIQYMEFNPTWTVPASIFRKDKLSRIRKDPGYLDRNNYIVRNADGNVVPASSVNWGAKNPGVTLVQKPGPDNALGLVKFMFPNDYAVYLHDTNQKELFDRNERNLSSGCVRLEYPFELASILMEADPEWSHARMQSILDSGKTTRINLPEPMPVLLTYWTAWVEDGSVHFREDPYERDGPILKALNR